MREKFARVHEFYLRNKEKVTTKLAKAGATAMGLSGSIMAMTVSASAVEGDVSLTTGLANVKTLLDWVWSAITGNTFLFTIFCMSLASMAFGLMRSAKRSPR